MFSYELSIPLKLLFNKSLSLGVCPNKWKLSFIVPIFKKGDPTDKENYRPISITSIISRVFERILVKHINFYLTTNSIISESQFGFRRGKSVESQLLKCYTHWITALDNNKFVDIIYLDYAKAFDKVCHNKLIAKLSNIGIVGPILDWIKSFLSQRVGINNTNSESANILSGVPQGSVIGPLLFVIYINDLVDSIDTDITINLFADDTKLSLIYNNLNDRDKLQSAINKFYNWSVLWQLENSAKISFSLTLGKVTIPTYYVNDARISYCSSYIDLGITIDDNLYFKKHIGVCCAKAYNVINRIFRCFITNNVTAILTAYIAYARPHLEFASTVWNPGIEARGYI